MSLSVANLGEDRTTMNIATILTLAFSTGLATAIFNQTIGWLRDARHERLVQARDACYLAIRLAVLLEQFGIACAVRISDQDLYGRHGGLVGASFGALPDLPPFPDEEDWKALHPDLLARVLTLRNELLLCGRAIALLANVYPEGVLDESTQQCGKAGHIAMVLAGDLRRHYHLPTFDPVRTSGNIMGTLKPLHDEVLLARERDGCATSHSSAARVKLSVRATDRKYRT